MTVWHTDQLNLPAYLDRIGYNGSLEPALGTLRALQEAHLDTIAFEGLDPVLGREVRIDIDSIQDKLVRRRRGGYCHEHNILFATVLDRLGFHVSGRSARILMGAETGGNGPVGHTILSVLLDGTDWHVDVGVGSAGPRGPIPLTDGKEIATGPWLYRIDRTPEREWVVRLHRPDGWFNVLEFSEKHYDQSDFEGHNVESSTDPSSPFTQGIVVDHNGNDERLTLANLELTRHRPNRAKEKQEITPQEIPETLRSVFGLFLPEELEQALMDRARGIQRQQQSA